MTVKEIVRDYLTANGYDGLWSDSGRCGCEVDDLFPCLDSWGNCQPGYKQPCDCGEGCRFHIGPREVPV